LQEAVVPPAEPAQLHDHGPLPLTADAVPGLQRLVVGALAKLPPFEEPHAPLTADEGAPHSAVEPPLLPAQNQVHGPLPLTADAVPGLQRLVVGALLTATPFAGPHCPFTGGAGGGGGGEASCATQVAVFPPLLPTQVQVQGPLPVTAVAVPALQRLVVGALVRLVPFEESHTPVTRLGCFCACAGPKTMNEMRRVNTAPRI
jgi:hypothetical protein